MLNHGSDAYRKCDKQDSVSNPSQTKHDANDHGRHTSIMKRNCASFANNILFRYRLVNQVVKVILKGVIHYLFLFIGMHFQIFVRKFPIYLCAVYASPQKVAQLLAITKKTYCPWKSTALERRSTGAYSNNLLKKRHSAVALYFTDTKKNDICWL